MLAEYSGARSRAYYQRLHLACYYSIVCEQVSRHDPRKRTTGEKILLNESVMTYKGNELYITPQRDY